MSFSDRKARSSLNTITASNLSGRPLARLSSLSRLEISVCFSGFRHFEDLPNVTEKSPETKLLRLGPEYDENLFLLAANYLLNASFRMTFFLAEFAERAWVEETLVPMVREANRCRQRLIARAESILGKTVI